jgi:UDP-N-acetylglucosamine kinase
MDDDKVKREAEAYVKVNKKVIKERFAGDDICEPDENPVSIFMAGSPGAGKTEFSKRFLVESGLQAVRIDADEIKAMIPQYTGANSSAVQGASALAVEYIYDYVLTKRKNAVFDATFSDFERSYSNVSRSLRKGRQVEVYYLYQDPIMAWRFTKICEALEGRVVPLEFFAKSFVDARMTVNRVKEEFGKEVKIHVIVRGYENQLEKFRLNVE